MNNEPDTIVAVLYECTTNDTNGNPRRCYTAIGGTGHILRVTDEGYAGAPDWVREMRPELFDVYVEVTPSHYRARVKLGEALDKGREALAR